MPTANITAYSSFSAYLGSKMMRCIEALWPQPTVASIGARARDSFSGVESYSLLPTTINNSGSAVIVLEDGLLVIIGGAQNVAQGVGLMVYYAEIAIAIGGGLVNRYCHAHAVQLKNMVDSVGVRGGAPIYVAGHSYGGAVAPILQQLLREAYPGSDVLCHTFGAPAAGDYGFQTNSPGRRVVRWMNANDPVPELPSTPLRLPIYYAAQPAALALAQRYYHVLTGNLITTNFEVHGAHLSSPTDMPYVASVPRWLAAMDGVHGRPHFAQTFIDALRSAAEKIGEIEFPTTRTDNRLHGHSAGTTPPRRTDFLIAPVILNPEEAPLVELPVTGIKQKVKVPFVAKRQGRKWSVLLYGEPIMVGSKRKTAQSLARIGNLFAKRLDALKTVQADGLLAGLFDHLLSAAQEHEVTGRGPLVNGLDSSSEWLLRGY